MQQLYRANKNIKLQATTSLTVDMLATLFTRSSFQHTMLHSRFFTVVLALVIAQLKWV